MLLNDLAGCVRQSAPPLCNIRSRALPSLRSITHAPSENRLCTAVSIRPGAHCHIEPGVEVTPLACCRENAWQPEAERADGEGSSSGWEEADDDEGEEGGDEEEGDAAGRGEGSSVEDAEGMPADGEPDQDDAELARRLQEEEDREHYRRLIELTGGGARWAPLCCRLSQDCLSAASMTWYVCARSMPRAHQCTLLGSSGAACAVPLCVPHVHGRSVVQLPVMDE